MKTIILALSLLSSLVLASQSTEIHACAQLNGFGEVQYRIDFLIRKKDQTPASINFIHSGFLSEPFIHKKSDKSFVGDKVVVGDKVQTAYTLEADNPDYLTVNSKITNLVKGSAALVPVAAQVAGMSRFETTLTEAVNEMRVTNIYVQNVLFKQEMTSYKIILDNSTKSYILNIQLHMDGLGFLTRTYSCVKI